MKWAKQQQRLWIKFTINSIFYYGTETTTNVKLILLWCGRCDWNSGRLCFWWNVWCEIVYDFFSSKELFIIGYTYRTSTAFQYIATQNQKKTKYRVWIMRKECQECRWWHTKNCVFPYILLLFFFLISVRETLNWIECELQVAMCECISTQWRSARIFRAIKFELKNT